ncbi:tRNA (5-methylaminomethyl-2-thiouridine)(34)-methyltransferase MnmD [Histidinibacterium lentulum]|uniref:FAD-dependent oxidoreductase n=1 Tax=Histidinibacterium lentulum TaxID=2480588 RepID=A0A3N2QR66_9RHOB|nr:tRNA (5-methylaminomethyl-2-thiouridine)(34)-methyltransferase MnmD [Histidinibacterium lentulum]ROT97679.1 FAD-dependent oxidoreductase [Histidinibacterium lentulum]
MQGQTARLDWNGDIPVATDWGDPYYSLENGAAESAHVFLAGSDLPARFRPGFHIAELGFGTGLNALLAWHAFRAACPSGTLRFTSFEARPMAPADRLRALSALSPPGDLAAFCAALARSPDRVSLPGLDLTVIPGDARATLPPWPERADAWFLDGFAPAKNPELWEPALLETVARHTAPGGTAATYTAAGHVRRALAAAGFTVTRTEGYGRKRHMTRARLP